MGKQTGVVPNCPLGCTLSGHAQKRAGVAGARCRPRRCHSLSALAVWMGLGRFVGRQARLRRSRLPCASSPSKSRPPPSSPIRR
eukprot:9471031-Pyramimonas_sp.AAC.1